MRLFLACWRVRRPLLLQGSRTLLYDCTALNSRRLGWWKSGPAVILKQQSRQHQTVCRTYSNLHLSHCHQCRAVPADSPHQSSRAGPVSTIRLKPRRSGDSAHSASPSRLSPPTRTSSPHSGRLPSAQRGRLEGPARDIQRARDRDRDQSRGRDQSRDRDRERRRSADAPRLADCDRPARQAPVPASPDPAATGRDSSPAAAPTDQLRPSGRVPSRLRPCSPEAARRADRGQHRLSHSTANPDLCSAARPASSPRHQLPLNTGHADRPSLAIPGHLLTSPHSSPQPSRPRDLSHADKPGAHRPHSARDRARSPRRPDSPAAVQQSRGQACGPSRRGGGPDGHARDLHPRRLPAGRPQGHQQARALQAQERPRQPQADRHRPHAGRSAPVNSATADGGAGGLSASEQEAGAADAADRGAGSHAEHRLKDAGSSGSGERIR